MRRALIALIALLTSPALAAQPPLYTYVFAVQPPYNAGSWSIWPGNGQLFPWWESTSCFRRRSVIRAYGRRLPLCRFRR